jgi:hypothetical protein
MAMLRLPLMARAELADASALWCRRLSACMQRHWPSGEHMTPADVLAARRAGAEVPLEVSALTHFLHTHLADLPTGKHVRSGAMRDALHGAFACASALFCARTHAPTTS